MPTNIVDFSACSSVIYEEPWYLHFWECTLEEYFEFLKKPEEFILKKVGINLPDNLRIETVVINHNFLEKLTPSPSPSPSPSPGPIICNIGHGGGDMAFYRVTSFLHTSDDIGKFKKSLLHNPSDVKKPNI